MSLEKPFLTSLLKELFPRFASESIYIYKKTPNGIPALIEDSTGKYWAKILITSKISDELGQVEQNALRAVSSQYVTKLLEVATKYEAGEKYDILLFPYVEGEDLENKLQQSKKANKPWSVEAVEKLLHDTASGISDLWSKGWVHQDIKPKNIRLHTGNNKYILLDLGIAHYAKDFNFSDGKHNREYVSPEQLRASLGEKVAITFNSDLFQLGTIAYYLLTLHHPFKDDQSKPKLNFKRITEGKYEDIKVFNKNVTDKLANIINKMLQPHSGYRYRDPKELLSDLAEQKYTIVTKFEEGVYFLPWPGPQGYKNILAFNCDQQPKGVVIPASHVPGEGYINSVRKQNYKLIFDPETYLLSDTINSTWHGNLSAFNWYIYPLNASYFRDPAIVKTFVANVIQSQLDLKTDYIIPPYFNIDNFDSDWREINALLYHESLKYYRRLGVKTPFLCGISLSQNLISVDESRKKIVDFYSHFSDVNAYFLRVDGKEQNTSIPMIKSMVKLIKDLQFHKPVLLADANIVSFGYLATGLSSLVTAFADSKREHDLAQKVTKKKRGGNYAEKYFVPKLFQFVKVEGELSTLIRQIGVAALCSCTICKNSGFDSGSFSGDIEEFISKWSKEDRGNHFLCCLIEWRDKIIKTKDAEKMNKYKEKLDETKKIFDDNRINLIFSQVIKEKPHLEWEAAFFSK